MAVQRNDIARKLIEHGADVNGKAANDLTALHTAAARGNLEAARLLLDHGADPNATSTDGKTPISYAEERNHPRNGRVFEIAAITEPSAVAPGQFPD